MIDMAARVTISSDEHGVLRTETFSQASEIQKWLRCLVEDVTQTVDVKQISHECTMATLDLLSRNRSVCKTQTPYICNRAHAAQAAVPFVQSAMSTSSPRATPGPR